MCRVNYAIIILSLLFLSNCKRQNDVKEISGPYLGQEPPGMKAELFAPGILSTDANEFNAVFTLAGDAIYFTGRGPHGQDIMVIEQIDGVWQERKPASFSDSYRDVDPFITPDGVKLFFSSNRPIDGNIAQEDCDFWYVEKLPSGEWSQAKHLNFPSTKGKHDFYYVSSVKGDIYFSIFEEGKGDIYFIPAESSNEKQIKLNSPINTNYNEHDPFIAPNGSYLIFSSDRPGGHGSNDLYICFVNDRGNWTEPVNMGDKINSGSYDYCPILSPDGKYFFFSSSRSGNGDVYWVDAKILEELKQDELK
ncbi:TolB family protein [Bacteroidota bacterium]